MLMLALLKRTILRFSAEGSHVIINHKIHKNSPYYMLDKENQLNKINQSRCIGFGLVFWKNFTPYIRGFKEFIKAN